MPLLSLTNCQPSLYLRHAAPPPREGDVEYEIPRNNEFDDEKYTNDENYRDPNDQPLASLTIPQFPGNVMETDEAHGKDERKTVTIPSLPLILTDQSLAKPIPTIQ